MFWEFSELSNFEKLVKSQQHQYETYFQGMGCEGACAHAHVRCAVARVRVRAKRLLKHVCEVCARGHF